MLILTHGGVIIVGGGSGFIKNSTLSVLDGASKLYIGNNTTIEGNGLFAATEGKMIYVGNDCMISDHCTVRNGDSHSIYDEHGKRINFAKNTIIESNVWIGAYCTILKGARIPVGSVLGTNSMVTKLLSEKNAIYVGCPSKLIKKGISWTRNR